MLTAPMARSSWVATLTTLPPTYLVVLAFGTLLGLMALVYSAPIVLLPGTVALGIALVLGGSMLAGMVRGRVLRPGGDWRLARAHAMGLFRGWFPFLALHWAYENVGGLTELVRPETLDPALANADLTLFGVHASLWMERFVQPWLTDLLGFVYALWLVVPAALLWYLHWRGKVKAFEEFRLAVLITCFAAFVGYALFPAVGPRFVLAGEYSVPLSGAVFELSNNLMQTLQTATRDCVPSMHTALSTLWLIFVIRHRRELPARWLAPALAALAVLIWYATIYLRQHWVVDVFIGWVHAAWSYGVADLLARWSSRRQELGWAPVWASARVGTPGR